MNIAQMCGVLCCQVCRNLSLNVMHIQLSMYISVLYTVFHIVLVFNS